MKVSCRLYLVVGLAAMCVPVAIAARSGAVSQARNGTKFDVNDVAYLWPLPQTAADVKALISASDSRPDGTPLWPTEPFLTTIATAQVTTATSSAGNDHRILFGDLAAAYSNPGNWKLAGFRVDPCAPGCDPEFQKVFGATPQLRLIFQPVTVEPNGKVTIHDLAAHLVFNFTLGPIPFPATPDRGTFLTIVNDLRSLKASSGVDTAGPLTIHPGFAAGGAAFRSMVAAFVAKHTAGSRLFAMAFMGLAPRPEPWLFFALARTPSGTFVPAPQRVLSGTSQMLTFMGGTAAMPVPTNSNIAAGKGVSTGVLFERGIEDRLDQPAIAGMPRPLHRDIPDLIANPSRAHFLNTDCVSCHTESTLRRRLKIESDRQLAYARPAGISGVSAERETGDSWNVRNFGWFKTQATVSHRTANEAAESAEHINREYLGAQSQRPAASSAHPQKVSPGLPQPVASPLTLLMKIKSPKDFAQLKALIEKFQALPPDQNPIMIALTRLGIVHYARFVFIEERYLAVITTYDGSFDDYIDAFVDSIGQVFDALLAHVEGAPPLPVSKHRQQFLDFVKRNDLGAVAPFYSAYPDLKVQDILTLRKKGGQ
jgi:hypothetical protein